MFITKGPSIKYVTLFLDNFDPLPCHTLSHIPGLPKKGTSHISDPPIFSRPSTKTGQNPAVQILSIVCAGFCPGGFVRGSLVWKVLSGVVFVRSPFCHSTSVTTES